MKRQIAVEFVCAVHRIEKRHLANSIHLHRIGLEAETRDLQYISISIRSGYMTFLSLAVCSLCQIRQLGCHKFWPRDKANYTLDHDQS